MNRVTPAVKHIDKGSDECDHQKESPHNTQFCKKDASHTAEPTEAQYMREQIRTYNITSHSLIHTCNRASDGKYLHRTICERKGGLRTLCTTHPTTSLLLPIPTTDVAFHLHIIILVRVCVRVHESQSRVHSTFSCMSHTSPQ